MDAWSSHSTALNVIFTSVTQSPWFLGAQTSKQCHCCNTGTWSPNKANLTPEDPTQRSYLDAFYDDEYDDSDNTDNSGFFSEPNFKHGVMTPDIWDMFKSDWGQKVQ